MATIPPPPGELIDVRGYRPAPATPGKQNPTGRAGGGPRRMFAQLGPRPTAGRIRHDRPQLGPGGPGWERTRRVAADARNVTHRRRTASMPLFVPPDLPPDVTTTYQALIAPTAPSRGSLPRRWRWRTATPNSATPGSPRSGRCPCSRCGTVSHRRSPPELGIPPEAQEEYEATGSASSRASRPCPLPAMSLSPSPCGVTGTRSKASSWSRPDSGGCALARVAPPCADNTAVTSSPASRVSSS